MALAIELSPETQAWLVEGAANMDQDLPTYVSRLLDRMAWTSRTLGETLDPVHQNFVDSGMTEDELGDLLDDAKHAMRADRRAAAVASVTTWAGSHP